MLPRTAPLDEKPSAIDLALNAIAAGELVLFLDEFRDVGVVATRAETVTAAQMNFFTTACRGIIYVAVSVPRLQDLSLPTIPHSGQCPENLHVPVDLRGETTTGISADDRAATARALVDETVSGDGFLRPGHITPVGLDPAGSLGRPGLPEAIRDFARAVGGRDGGAFCAVLDDDGRMAGAQALRAFAARHMLPVVTIADAVRLRRQTEDWSASPAEEDEIDLPFLGVRALVRVRGGWTHQLELPVIIQQLCPASLLSPSCGCSARLADARARHDALPRSALALWWQRHDLGAWAAHGGEPAPFEPGLADLVAARVAGGYAVQSDREAET